MEGARTPSDALSVWFIVPVEKRMPAKKRLTSPLFFTTKSIGLRLGIKYHREAAHAVETSGGRKLPRALGGHQEPMSQEL